MPWVSLRYLIPLVVLGLSVMKQQHRKQSHRSSKGGETDRLEPSDIARALNFCVPMN